MASAAAPLREALGRIAARLAEAARQAPEAELRAAAAGACGELAALTAPGGGEAIELSARLRRQPANPFDRLLPLMRDRETVVLCQGVPPDTLFPLRAIDLALKGPEGARVAIGEADTHSAQRYAPFAWGRLKAWIEPHVRAVHAPACEDWAVSIAAGSMSSVDLAIGLFLNPGDSALIEEYSFLAAVDAFAAAGVRLVPIAGDARGLRPEVLREALAAEAAAGRPAPRALYVVPVGQNPCGTTLAPERYREVYDICAQERIVILEDDAYFYQQHNACDAGGDGDDAGVAGVRGLAPTSFLRLDASGIVLRLDSFSKVVAPGFRLGWVTGPRRFVEAYDRLAYVSSQNGCSLSMVCLGALLEHWCPDGFEAHVRQLQLALRRRCRALVRACEAHLAGAAEWRCPGAGMFLWLRLTSARPFTEEELVELMREERVAVMPGACCAAARGERRPYLRLSYVAPEESYDEGMRRLRRVLDRLRA